MTDDRRSDTEAAGAFDEADPVEEAGSGAAANPDGAAESEAEAISEISADATDRLEMLQQDLDSLNERHLRLAAEFDNYRKRIDKERTELWSRAQAELAKRLLDALDDLQRVTALEEPATTADAVLEGVALVEKKLRHALESAGLEPIDAAGEFFNPATMEALMTVPAEHPEEDEVVADVFQKGYRFKDMLIRPARVRVKKYEAT